MFAWINRIFGGKGKAEKVAAPSIPKRMTNYPPIVSRVPMPPPPPPRRYAEPATTLAPTPQPTQDNSGNDLLNAMVMYELLNSSSHSSECRSETPSFSGGGGESGGGGASSSWDSQSSSDSSSSSSDYGSSSSDSSSSSFSSD